jgi:hypothetical protein
MTSTEHLIEYAADLAQALKDDAAAPDPGPAITLPPPTARQVRYPHLCKLLQVQEPRPDAGDGYTGADWAAWRAGEYASEDARRDAGGR